jgi:hypothetical protein
MDEPQEGGRSEGTDQYGVTGPCDSEQPCILGVRRSIILHSRHVNLCSVTHVMINTPSWFILYVSRQTCAEHLADEKQGMHPYFFQFSCPPIFHIYPRYLQGIDQDLKYTCESIISVASEPLCAPLRAFTCYPASAAEVAVLGDGTDMGT